MATEKLIGRKYEQSLFDSICLDSRPELIAVYGRRRVGKTFLIKQYFQGKFDFYFTGSYQTPAKIQLALFSRALSPDAGEQTVRFRDWFEAFDALRRYLEKQNKDRLVVFLDELPWMDTPKSNFLAAFSYFWNTWGESKEGLKFIVCGSSTSWMVNKIIGGKGGLYGRTSRTIYLRPFSLGETEAFLKAKGIDWTRYKILEAYMIFGGIPYYLDKLDPNQPFAANIDRLFFREKAELQTEYTFLFSSLFRAAKTYQQVVEALAKKRSGLTLEELKSTVSLGDGGRLTEILANLISCDFVRKYCAFGKKRNGAKFQLIDPFCLFYLAFVRASPDSDKRSWTLMSEARHNAWTGLSFELVCLLHVEQIKAKLGISGVLTNVFFWSVPKTVDKDGTEWSGAQVDLLLQRSDKVINLCEMKYADKPFVITGDYEARLRERAAVFAHHTKTRDAVHLTFVTPYGVQKNAHAQDVRGDVTADDLFRMPEEV